MISGESNGELNIWIQLRSWTEVLMWPRTFMGWSLEDAAQFSRTIQENELLLTYFHSQHFKLTIRKFLLHLPFAEN